MFSKLRQHGLVESTRGPGGGYALARSAERITVADIVGAIEGHTDSSAKGVTRGGEPTVQDMTQDLSEALNSKVLDYLQSVTLYSLVLAQLAKGVKIEQKRRPIAVCSKSRCTSRYAPTRPIRCLRWASPCWRADKCEARR